MTVIAVDITEQSIHAPCAPAAPGSPVWVKIRPNLRRSHTVATDILAALGKRRDLAGKGRNQHEDMCLAAAWLRANDTEHVVLIDAQHLGSLILASICRLAEDANVDLWLLHRAPSSDTFARALARRAQSEKTIHDVPAPVERTPIDASVTAFPAVPRHDVHLFRSAVDRALHGAEHDLVIRTFESAARAADETFHQAGTGAETVRQIIDDLLEDAPGDDLLLARIRGAQLAAWHHDLFIRVDATALLASEERPTLPSSRVDEALTAYRQPHRIITCSLTNRGQALRDIANLRTSDIDKSGQHLSIAGDTVTVSDNLNRALRVARDLTNQRGDDRLLPYAEQSLATIITDATHDLGLHVKGRRAERTRPKHTAYLARLGITLRSLT